MKSKQNNLKIVVPGFVLMFLLILTTPVSAANFSVSDKYISVKKGDVINVVINVSSENTGYTFKSAVNFPSDLVSVTDWKWDNAWIPVSQDGYELIDNNNGIIIHTAGYPGGISGEQEFGIITFVAKRSGDGIISFDQGNSFILDENSENILN